MVVLMRKKLKMGRQRAERGNETVVKVFESILNEERLKFVNVFKKSVWWKSRFENSGQKTFKVKFNQSKMEREKDSWK